MKQLLSSILVICSLTLTAVSEENTVPAKKLWAKSILGQKAPELVVEKWLTPEPSTKGKFVLVDFWATWCGPCRKAIPELNKFQKQFSDKLVVVGISDEPEEKIRAMATPAIEYASAMDTQGRMKKQIEVKGIPHVIVIDPQGVVQWEGFPLLDGFELTEDVLKKILAK
jgi:cytochrome c biogenesis protein CcmG/thiol:disulfide interchange protein DsbE